MRRFFKDKNNDLVKLHDKVAIQLTESSTSLAIVELYRVLVDVYDMEYVAAWNIVQNVFTYTYYAFLSEVTKWSVVLLGRVLPRHLELIYLINHYWIEKLKQYIKFDWSKLATVSIVEESYPKQIRMTNFCVIGCHKVVGILKAHTRHMKNSLFNEYYLLEPNKFMTIKGGISLRRWLGIVNPDLSRFYADILQSRDFLLNYDQIRLFKAQVLSAESKKKWNDIKLIAKERLARFAKETTKVSINANFLFDVIAKQFNEGNRQLMSLLFILYRYLQLKSKGQFQKE